jgi:hypothetical protein
MTVIHHLCSAESVETAWQRFREHMARSFADRSLLLDREYQQEWARRERRFKQLFNMTEAGQ